MATNRPLSSIIFLTGALFIAVGGYIKESIQVNQRDKDILAVKLQQDSLIELNMNLRKKLNDVETNLNKSVKSSSNTLDNLYERIVKAERKSMILDRY